MSTWRTSQLGSNTVPNAITLAEPTGIAAGDFEFVLFSAPAGSVFNTPAGWTLFGSASGASAKYAMYYVTGGRGGSAPTLNFTGTFAASQVEYHVLAFTNGSVNIDASATTTLGVRTTPDCPAATATGAADEALAIAFQFQGATWTQPSGYTMRSVNTGGLDCMCSSKTLSAAGVENPGAYNAAAATADCWEITLLIGASGSVNFRRQIRRPFMFLPGDGNQGRF